MRQFGFCHRYRLFYSERHDIVVSDHKPDWLRKVVTRVVFEVPTCVTRFFVHCHAAQLREACGVRLLRELYVSTLPTHGLHRPALPTPQEQAGDGRGIFVVCHIFCLSHLYAAPVELSRERVDETEEFLRTLLKLLETNAFDKALRDDARMENVAVEGDGEYGATDCVRVGFMAAREISECAKRAGKSGGELGESVMSGRIQVEQKVARECAQRAETGGRKLSG